jgi:hypothetical protein
MPTKPAEEKKPHDERCKAVQAKWKPIIDKADLATSTAKEALAPWLRKVEEQQARSRACPAGSRQAG